MTELGLKHKTAVITGATHGIGLASALMLAKGGAEVFINGKDGDSAMETAREYREGGLSIHGVVGDVSREDFADDFIKNIYSQTGRIDILVNNAGASSKRMVSFEKIETELWDQYQNSHLRSAFLLCRAAAPIMQRQKNGKIINIISAATLIRMGPAHYIAAKSGLMGLTKSLAQELAKFNIQVNAIAPGLVDTPTSHKNYPPLFFNKVTQYTPAGRIAKPDDIAKAVLFFASSLSDFVSGQILTVDGGFILALE